jgi:hypothetical protein
LEDGSHISCNETIINDVLFSHFVKELEQEFQGDARVFLTPEVGPT